MKKRLLFSVLILLLNVFGVKAQVTLGFEGNTGAFPGGSGSSESAAVVEDAGNSRTGNYYVRLATTSTGATKYWYTNSIVEGPSANGTHVHCVFWAKKALPETDVTLTLTATMRYSSSSSPSGGGSSQSLGQSASANLTFSNGWQRVSGSATNSSARYYFPAPTRAEGVAATIYVDDMVMYKSNNATTDLLSPNQPENILGNYSNGNALLTWTSGGDNTAAGSTGVQASMILKYTGDSETPVLPILNNQANYSVNDVVGTDWIVVKTNGLAEDSSLDMGAIAASTTFAIYHRDLAYNWSSGTSVRVEKTLPISLISFSAKSAYNGVNLSWLTASESNTARFIVERIAEDGGIQEVATTKAAGNSNKQQNYTATDKNVTAGETYYYRLKTLDIDGTVSYSDVESVQFNSRAIDNLSVYPNPAANQITIELKEVFKGVGIVNIVDLTGQTELSSTIPQGSKLTNINVSRLSPGIYIIQVNHAGKKISTKFLKK